ncbi:hypothetical protein RvY_19367 [Ramazzottius varieornatus]|uniref:Uncharacterized protein n=1 Tax=Ramazzottius varieornatus TaxID=947166 RepID=A0A1D1WC88_RAMVA|nr:hypothetical protein RvY_19367 [Ramazzottius varieornatus]
MEFPVLSSVRQIFFPRRRRISFSLYRVLIIDNSGDGGRNEEGDEEAESPRSAVSDPKPRAIQGLAYESKSYRLAVVKCTVDAQENIPAAYFVEIWNLRDFPCLEFKVTLAPEWRQSVEAICWRSSVLLFISGMHGQVLLVDVETSRLRGQAAAVSGPVWCLSLNPQKNRLAAGTEDGYISLFDVENEELVIYSGLLEPKGSRILSLSWHLTKPLLVSSGRGRVWLWDVDAMKLRTEMRPPKHGNIESSVSSVIFLRNGTVVSGDTTGATIFWDISHATPIASFKSRSGVLALAHSQSPDGISVFSAGIDSVISEMRLTNKQGSSSWVRSLPRYIHSHDVRALCRAGKFLVSGGQDSYLMFGNDVSIKQTIKIPPNTNSLTVAVARNLLHASTPFLLLQNSSKLEIWQLSSQQNSFSADNFRAVPFCQLLSLTFGKGNECITASAISPSGEWLVASSHRLTKAYRIVPSKAESLVKNAHDKVDIDLVPASKSTDIFALPVDSLTFSEEGRLVVADSSEVFHCKLKWIASGEHSASVVDKRNICSLFPGEFFLCIRYRLAD